MPNFAAELRDISVIYDRGVSEPVLALDGVSIGFARGTSTAIIGRSGSGKSTLASVLTLLRRPTSGTVFVDNCDVTESSDQQLARVRRSIGIVFQSFHVDDKLTVLDNVMLPYYLGYAGGKSELRARAMRLLDGLGISSLSNRKVQTLSGGQRQRVAVARALMGRPALLVADEPTGSLDERTADLVVTDILELGRALGTAVALVTHDQQIAQRTDRVVHMVAGQLRQGKL